MLLPDSYRRLLKRRLSELGFEGYMSTYYWRIGGRKFQTKEKKSRSKGIQLRNSTQMIKSFLWQREDSFSDLA